MGSTACTSNSSSPGPGDRAPVAGDDASSAPGDTVPPGDGRVTDVTFTRLGTQTVTDPATGHVAFPDLARLANGDLFVVYRLGASHVDASGRIVAQRSTNDGTTWSMPEVLIDAPGVDDRDPSVTVLANGDVLVTYFQYVHDAGLTLHHVFAGISDDHGVTFGAFEPVDPGAMSAPGATLNADGLWVDGEGELIEVWACSSPVARVAGDLVLPAYGGPTLNLANLAGHPRSRITLFTRPEAGGAWSAAPVDPTLSEDVWLQEPFLLPLTADRWLLQVRTSTGASPSDPGDLAQAVSDDGGQTWSDFAPLGFIGHAPYLLRLDNGVLVSAFRRLNASYTEEDVAFVHSLDDGATWSEPAVIVDCGAAECGYPSLLQLDAHRLLVAYYAAGGAAIETVTYRIDVGP